MQSLVSIEQQSPRRPCDNKLEQPHFQEPKVEYCELQQVLDICSYNHYPALEKDPNAKCEHNSDNDIYDTSEIEHEF